MVKIWLHQFILCCGLLLSLNAQSHQISTAYLTINATTDVTQGQYQVKLQDLAYQVNLDLNNNQSITWAEVKAQRTVITQWFQTSLIFNNNGSQCERYGEFGMMMDSHFNEPYLVIGFTVQCDSGKPTEISYQGIFELNSGHKMIVNVDHNNDFYSRVVASQQRSMTLDEHASDGWQTFKEYTHQGVIHILIGLDHIMFLLCLLLSAILINKLQPKRLTNKATVWHVLGLVTFFTLAHSVTLVLTAINWLAFPSRWVEIIIALTVAVAALNNIWPFIRRLKLVTFLFGLIHGMGFAGVLGELGLPADAKLIPILAFNLGVELGQVILIVLILPTLLWLDRNWLKAQKSLRITSALILILAIYWVIERF